MTTRRFLLPSITMKLVATAATLLLWFFATHGALGAPRTADPVPRELLDHCMGCDAHGMDLHGRDLHGIRLVGANLSGTDLRGANLRGASLTGCNLRNAKLDGADLTDVRMTGVSLEGATFTGAKLQGLKLTGVSFRGGSTLSNLDLSGIHVIGSNLREVIMRHTKLDSSHMIGVDLRNADLTGASLRNAVICFPKSVVSHDGVVKADAEMRCIDLGGAHLRGTDLRGMKYCTGERSVIIKVRAAPRSIEPRAPGETVTPASAPAAPESRSATMRVEAGDGDVDCRSVTPDELRIHSHADLDGAQLN